MGLNLRPWFSDRGWKPFLYQRSVWRAYGRGESGLIHAPTGLGKTLAAWGGPLLHTPASEPGDGAHPCTILWITPLRALAADTAASLRAPVADLRLPWTVAVRTGDTPAGERARLRRRLPSALITTPESLSLMLTYPEARERFRHLEAVIVDEWHELLGSKRGVQTELCLARLRTWRPRLRTWGLSATIGNLEQAMRSLLGTGAGRGRLIEGPRARRIRIDTLVPATVDRFPWSGHLGTVLLDEVIGRIDAAGTTLLFTNTRSQVELWFRALLERCPEWADSIAMHHGSLEQELRREVEDRLRSGTVRCVVCTSSLDLGVDFSPVDQVIQVGSPKGIARLMQRAGRSGHSPGAISRIVGVPTNALELVEFAAARDALGEAAVEERIPLRRPLDVLVQHLVTVAAGEGFRDEEMLREVRETEAYAGLSDEEWGWALQFVTTGGNALRAYPQYTRVRVGEDGIHRMDDRRLLQVHRMSIGTITSDYAVTIRYANGRRLGTVEEWFISHLRPGSVFLFAGRRLELVRFREVEALVRPASGRRKGEVPMWGGGRMPLSTELAEAVSRRLVTTLDQPRLPRELRAFRPLLALQAEWSRIPHAGVLLIEEARTREGEHVFLYPFAGRLVHEGLASLLAHRLARSLPVPVHIAFNDYGIELQAERDLFRDSGRWRQLLAEGALVDDLVEAMNTMELARHHFREVSRVAGLIFPGFPRRRKAERQMRMSSGLLYDVLGRYDPGNLLLRQARREILEKQLELTRLRATLRRMEQIPLEIVPVASLTPMAFPLWADRISQRSTREGGLARLSRMLEALEARAGGGGG